MAERTSFQFIISTRGRADYAESASFNFKSIGISKQDGRRWRAKTLRKQCGAREPKKRLSLSTGRSINGQESGKMVYSERRRLNYLSRVSSRWFPVETPYWTIGNDAAKARPCRDALRLDYAAHMSRTPFAKKKRRKFPFQTISRAAVRFDCVRKNPVAFDPMRIFQVAQKPFFWQVDDSRWNVGLFCSVLLVIDWNWLGSRGLHCPLWVNKERGGR